MRNDFFNDSGFNSRFNKVEKTVDRTFMAIVIVWIIGAIGSLAALGGLGYVAWHFLQKVW